MTSETRVGVSLLTCNLSDQPVHLRATEYALHSLLDSDLQDCDWQLQVLDNGSTCGRTLDLLRGIQEKFARVDVVFSAANRGISRGRNLCYQMLADRHAPEFLVEVHADHVFPRRWLTPLIRRMQMPGNERTGVVGPGLLTGRGQWMSPRFGLTYDAPYAEFRAGLESSVELWRRNGRALPGLSHPAVIRWAMVEELNERDDAGMLCVYDPRLPGLQNFEDTELCYRAAKAGWQILIDFSSMVYHHYTFMRCTIMTGDDGIPRLDPNHVHTAGHDNVDGYNANAVYSQTKHGPDFVRFTGEIGRWMDRAYRS